MISVRSASAAALFALVVGGVAALRWLGGAESTMSKADQESVKAFAASARKLTTLQRKKTAPGPNDWLARHQERGQTFQQYVRSNPIRPTRARTTIYLQPIGDFGPTQDRLITATADLLARFYNVPTKVLEPLNLDQIPAKARRVHPEWGDHQLLTTYILDEVLKPQRPSDAVAVLALTTADLFPGEDWNFVFGQASLSERVGVWSLYRYGDADGDEQEYQQFRQRMFKVALHETGHMLGIAHCTAYECGMNGSNHLKEMDSRPSYFCVECEPKIWWACRANPIERYQSLIDFAREHDLTDEAGFWQASCDRLTN